MAFRFFRRRQKTVIIIMVALMVSFLVGFQGLNSLMRPSRTGRVIARLRNGHKIKNRDIRLALSDVEMISSEPSLVSPALESILAGGRGMAAAEVYAILLAEAFDVGSVRQEEVDAYLNTRGVTGVRYAELISRLRARGIPEKELRAALARQLLVYKSFFQALVDTPPSEPRLRRRFVDVTEKVTLRVVKIPAEPFLADVPEPAAEAVQRQFDRYQNALAGEDQSADSFAFGYKRPSRVDVQYLFVRRDLVERVTRIPAEQAREYFIDHQHDEDFLEQLGPLEEDEDGEAPDLIAPVRFSDVREAIVRKLRQDAVRAKLNDILSTTERHLWAMGRQGGAGASYEQALAKMTLPAEAALSRRLATVGIDRKPLGEALATLAEAANLAAISFPYGTQDGHAVDARTRVKLRKKDITLGEVLAAICKQLKWPELTWARCTAFAGAEDVLFAAGPARSLPFEVGQTGLVTLGQVARHPVLGRALTGGSQPAPLALLAFQKDVFREADQEASAAYRPHMQVMGDEGGTLLWRIVEARPAEVSHTMTDDIAQEVIGDLKAVQAMALAEEAGAKLLDQAAKRSLEKAAKSADYDSSETDPLVRRTLLGGQPESNPLPGVRLSPASFDKFMTAAFDLIDKRELLDDESDKAPAVMAVVSLPLERTVCVIELLAHEPATADEYRQARSDLLGIMRYEHMRRAFAAWFSREAVIERTGYRPRG